MGMPWLTGGWILEAYRLTTITTHESYTIYSLSGAFDDESLYQTYSDLWTSSDYTPTKPELHDLRVADFSRVTAAGIRNVAKLYKRLHSSAPQRPNAILAVNELNSFYALMASRLAEEWNPNVRVFQDHEEAVVWVSLEGARTS